MYTSILSTPLPLPEYWLKFQRTYSFFHHYLSMLYSTYLWMTLYLRSSHSKLHWH